MNLKAFTILFVRGYSLFCVLPLFVPMAVLAQSGSYIEEKVKAVFLYNFTQFVEWPVESGAAGESSEAFVIGILGKDPFGNYLDQAIAGEHVNGRPILTQRYKTVAEVGACHILYIDLKSSEMKTALETLAGKPVLTVGEDYNFLKNGGIVRFVIRENKVHFIINLPAAEANGLQISSKLLRLAEIYNPG